MLYGHCDAVLLANIRTKLSMMFRQDVRPYITGANASHEDREAFNKNAAGILGGKDIVASRMKDPVTEDALAR